MGGWGGTGRYSILTSFVPGKAILCTLNGNVAQLVERRNHLARHSERGKKTRRTKEEVGRQHQGMDRPGVRRVPEGSGEQGKLEKTGCKIICGASTTLAVKGLMMMMMRASNRHAADAGSSPRCGKGFFSQSTFSADSLMVSVHPRLQSHALTSVRTLKIL